MSGTRANTQPYGHLDTLPPASPGSSGVAPRPCLQALVMQLRREWLEVHADYRTAELEYSRLALRVAPCRFAARARARELEIKLDALSAEIEEAEAVLKQGVVR